MLPGSLFKGQAGEGDSLGHVQRRWKTIIAPGRSRCLRGCLGEVAVEVEGQAWLEAYLRGGVAKGGG